jgi:hypothetical protein
MHANTCTVLIHGISLLPSSEEPAVPVVQLPFPTCHMSKVVSTEVVSNVVMHHQAGAAAGVDIGQPSLAAAVAGDVPCHSGSLSDLF